MVAHSDCRLGYESPDDAPPSRQCRQRDPCDCWDVRRSGRIWMNHAVRSMEHRLSVSSSPIYSSQSPGRVRIWASMLWPCASLISLMRATPIAIRLILRWLRAVPGRLQTEEGRSVATCEPASAPPCYLVAEAHASSLELVSGSHASNSLRSTGSATSSHFTL